MADAIGILGFALHAAHRVYQLIEKIREAPEEIRGLQKEVTRVRALLDGLRDDLQTGQLSMGQDLLKPLLEEAEQLTAATETFLKKVTKENTRDPGRTDVDKIKWLLNPSHGKKLGEQYSRFYISHSSVYAVALSRTTVDALVGIRQIQQTMKSMSTNGSYLSSEQLAEFRVCAMRMMLEYSLRSAAQDQRRGRSHLFDEICNDSNPSPVEILTVPFPTPHVSLSRINSLESQEQAPDTNTEVTSRNGSDDDTASHSGPLSQDAQPQQLGCEDGCRCRCHRRRSVRPIPNSLAPWLGALHIPGTLISSFWPAFDACDRLACQRKRTSLRAIKYFLPTWFVQVEASIRFESFPVHFCIQTPRVVETLDFLNSISLDDFKQRLSTRRITIYDTDPVGCPIIHQLITRSIWDTDTAHDMLSYILNRGAPREWCYWGLTPAEYSLLYYESLFMNNKAQQEYVQSVIIRGLLDEDVAEASEGLSMKMRQTKLHQYVINAGLSTSTSLASLSSVLHDLAAEVNIEDSMGRPPLLYALYNFPLAVEPLLRAGANPWLINLPLLCASEAGASAAVSPLIRAGVDVNKRDKYGNTPLHTAAWPDMKRFPNGYSVALELVRHGGDTLNWEARNRWDGTPLDEAEEGIKRNPLDEEFKLLLELYITRRLPVGASSPSCVVELPTDGAELRYAASTSLIHAGLCGDIKAIGDLICAGAVVNEVDEHGRTLLHLVAMGGHIADGYQVALELVRHGGYGVHWDAVTSEGKTALELAEERLVSEDMDDAAREEAEAIFDLLQDRCLPLGEEYIFPCMDPNYCKYCSSNPCWCGQQDVPGVPGTFVP